jgi:hypothetical protein
MNDCVLLPGHPASGWLATATELLHCVQLLATGEGEFRAVAGTAIGQDCANGLRPTAHTGSDLGPDLAASAAAQPVCGSPPSTLRPTAVWLQIEFGQMPRPLRHG